MYMGKIPHGPPPTSEMWSSEGHQDSDIGSATSFCTLDNLLLEAHPISLHTVNSTKVFSSVQFRHLVVSTLCRHRVSMNCSSLSITDSWSLLKLMSIELVMPSNHLIFYCPFLLPPSIFPSIRVFSSESVLYIRWPKYWSFNFSISPSNEYSGLTSFRMDWLGLLAVQGTLKSLLQHHTSKASVLQCSAFFIN